jgi:hypothetical protein
MMKEIEEAGLNNLRFAWAGDQQPGIGRPHYYRIQGLQLSLNMIIHKTMPIIFTQ